MSNIRSDLNRYANFSNWNASYNMVDELTREFSISSRMLVYSDFP